MSIRTSLVSLVTLAAKVSIGLALLSFAFANVHEEMRRPGPSTVRVVLFVVLGLVGALVMPSIGDAVYAAGLRAVSLGQYGRRAYDNSNAAPPVPPGDQQ